ncbi:hypothetical protein IJJ97_03730 [bacterium]|nr:hypothetical protein [bacterium]
MEKEERKLPSDFFERFEALENQVAEIKSILTNLKSSESNIESEKLEQVVKKVEESVKEVGNSVSEMKIEDSKSDSNVEDETVDDEIEDVEESFENDSDDKKSDISEEAQTDEIKESIKKEQVKFEDDPFKKIEDSYSDKKSSNSDSKSEKTNYQDSEFQKGFSEPQSTKSNNYIEFIKKFFLMASIVLILICGSSYLAIYAKNNVVKLLIILTFSTIMTYVGFQQLLKGKKNVLSFFLTGAGSGLYLVAILASYFAFKFIDSTYMLILAGFWSWSFIY